MPETYRSEPDRGSAPGAVGREPADVPDELGRDAAGTPEDGCEVGNELRGQRLAAVADPPVAGGDPGRVFRIVPGPRARH
ncbi:hypothetical protein VR43_11595, partial [Streptomyces sp. NRRL S-104]|uniref:hypothetical protein n=1 Tax=Streptomyces sp. NRRL S-104 TaxID=1609135 RepID=UPI0005F8D0FE